MMAWLEFPLVIPSRVIGLLRLPRLYQAVPSSRLACPLTRRFQGRECYGNIPTVDRGTFTSVYLSTVSRFRKWRVYGDSRLSCVVAGSRDRPIICSDQPSACTRCH